jgi:hypothetical protein
VLFFISTNRWTSLPWWLVRPTCTWT